MYQLTNQELRTLNNRQQLEYNYKLNNPSKFRKTITAIGIAGTVAGAIESVNKLYSNSDKLKKNGQKIIKSGKDIIEKIRKRVRK